MSSSSNIEWTDATWNPTVGCSKVSEGCRNCYAMTMARRIAAAADAKGIEASPKMKAYQKVVARRPGSVNDPDTGTPLPQWNNKVVCVEEALEDPLHWKKPRRIFVDSQSDLFHPDVPFAFIEACFGVMAWAKQHTFQILTKRPERSVEFYEYMDEQARGWMNVHGHPPHADVCAHRAWKVGDITPPVDVVGLPWPLPNVWLGTSCENQATADERIPHLLECPAAVRFISAEPLLGPVNIQNACTKACPNGDCYQQGNDRVVIDSSEGGIPIECACSRLNGIRWVIVGGESGGGARPCDIAWIRSIVDQCRAAGVGCFVKQLGAKPYLDDHAYCRGCNRWDHADQWDTCKVSDTNHETAVGVIQHSCGRVERTYTGQPQRLQRHKGDEIVEWPEALRVREFPKTGVANGNV